MECHAGASLDSFILRLVQSARFCCPRTPQVAPPELFQPLLTRCFSCDAFLHTFRSSLSYFQLWSAHARPLQVVTSAWTVATKNIVITVGGNTTDNGTTTFVPQRVDATRGDVVVFNCTLLPFLSLSRSDS